MLAWRQPFERCINQHALRGLREIDRADLLAFRIFHDDGRSLRGSGDRRAKKRNGSQKSPSWYIFGLSWFRSQN
jgi:hypothetical protein